VPSLHFEIRGSGEPLVLVHGFTQSSRAWGRAGELLEQRFRVMAFDAPGHGQSASVAADLPTGADRMAAAVENAPAWLGYSMGGRFALHVAVRHPEKVRRLIVVSATAGIDDPIARVQRQRSDEQLAERVLEEGLEPFVRWWLDQPIFASLPAEDAALEGRLGGTSAGLASSLRLAGAGAQEPLWDLLPRLEMPVLLVAGELDTKYRELAQRLARTIGDNATVRIVQEAGHACHLEKPDEFVEAVTSWLDSAQPAS
jgi:2-succinyl-6-hydroxy-2,4-cyclohexadiene-1-carboxylate synthase